IAKRVLLNAGRLIAELDTGHDPRTRALRAHPPRRRATPGPGARPMKAVMRVEALILTRSRVRAIAPLPFAARIGWRHDWVRGHRSRRGPRGSRRHRDALVPPTGLEPALDPF